jgi:hypothetical protein
MVLPPPLSAPPPLPTQAADTAAAKEGTKLEGLPDSINANKPPKNYKDAMSREDSREWQDAYFKFKEYKGMINRGAVRAVKPPPGAKILGTTTRTEYKTSNGIFDKRKVRMCVRGDQQVEGQDFFQQDLYAPTLKAQEARLIAAIAAQHGAKLFKTDCKQAFLYGDMDDVEIYIKKPDWWPVEIPEGHVLLLCKSVYGTRQAARKWHICISRWMNSQGYAAVNNEETIFMKWEGKDFIIHGLFVDDMQHTSTSQALMDEFMHAYSRDFEITGGEIMTTFLGLQVDHVNSEIHMHMDHYVETVLNEYKTFVMNKTLRHKMLPVQPNYQLPKGEPKIEGKGEDPRTTFYRSFVMKLQYVATWVRFDISFTASQLASHVANPGPAHWAALHLMEYLNHYPSFKLVYRRGLRTGQELDALADSDWGTDVETRKSISGQITRYNKTPISWRSKKQQSVALSSAEAEYMAVSDFSKEIIYLRQLLRNMGFHQEGPTTVYEDNTACIEWGNNVIGGRERAKHIDIRKHFANETIKNGHMTLKKIATTAQLADIMTKGVSQLQWTMCIEGLLGQPLKPSDKSVMAQEGED